VTDDEQVELTDGKTCIASSVGCTVNSLMGVSGVAIVGKFQNSQFQTNKQTNTHKRVFSGMYFVTYLSLVFVSVASVAPRTKSNARLHAAAPLPETAAAAPNRFTSLLDKIGEIKRSKGSRLMTGQKKGGGLAELGKQTLKLASSQRRKREFKADDANKTPSPDFSKLEVNMLKRFIVLPEYKLVFCYIEKVRSLNVAASCPIAIPSFRDYLRQLGRLVPCLG
jgi:hypothetical protein